MDLVCFPTILLLHALPRYLALLLDIGYIQIILISQTLLP